MSVQDAPAESRYEIDVDGALAGFTEYELDESTGTITFVHTEVDPNFGGQGIGSKLAAGALEDVRRRGLHVQATCEFMAGYLEKHHAEYADLLAPPAGAEA